MITATITTLADGHACYSVAADLDGVGRRLIYVGACPMAQIAILPDAQHNSEWQRLIMRDTVLTITICSVFDDPADAAGMATTLASGLRPWMNVNGTRIEPHSRSGRSLLCSDGRRFDNSATAAVALGVTASAVSKHLNGRLAMIAGVKLARTV